MEKLENFQYFWVEKCALPKAMILCDLEPFFSLWLISVTLNHTIIVIEIHKLQHNWVAPSKKVLEHAQTAQIQSILRIRKVPPESLLFIDFVVSNGSVSRQWRPRSDCASAQSDLGLHCPYMPEDMFLHDMAQLINTLSRPNFNIFSLYFWPRNSIFRSNWDGLY